MMGGWSEKEMVWELVLHETKKARNAETWGNEVISILVHNHSSSPLSLPSLQLTHLLLSSSLLHSPLSWKLLDKALSLNLISPFLLIALLSKRHDLFPSRHLHPPSYTLYMHLLTRFLFSPSQHLLSLIHSPRYHMVMKSIHDVLHLSHNEAEAETETETEPGVVLVQFLFSILSQLLEATVHDEGLLHHHHHHHMDHMDNNNMTEEKEEKDDNKTENTDESHRANTAMAIEIIAHFLQNKVTSTILSLHHRNMPSQWGSFIQQLQILASKSLVLRNLKHITPEALLLSTQNIISHESRPPKSKLDSNGLIAAGQSYGDPCSSLWLPFDIILEEAMAPGQVSAFSAVDILAGLVKSLHAVNGSTWHNAFLALWVAALRLVLRGRDSNEAPFCIDTRLCMLLCITVLAVTKVIDEEEGELIEEAEHSHTSQRRDNQRRREMVTSLQLLGEYECLLAPPQSVVLEANEAAAKAIMFLSGNPVCNINDLPMKCSGNFRHLIVEACIARNLLDTSAYTWPGYVNACSNQIPCSISSQVAGWSLLMKGSQLTPELVNVLVSTPASSLAEIEKIYEIAIKGSDEEKIYAATILCGSSLVRGWNVQEHTVLFIIKLLSPTVPPNYSGTESHLISQAPLLNVLLVGISSSDCIHIFSLHGLVPLLAGGLMLLCEVFGSCASDASQTLATGEELSYHEVFSNAFTLLLRFWRFDLPTHEHLRRDGGPPFGSLICPEYLLTVRNSKLESCGRSAKDKLKNKRLSKILSFSKESVFMHSFPKLNFWYRQHQECIASIRSGLVPGGPVHQIVDALLNIMFRKINKGAETLTPMPLGSSSSSGSDMDVDALVKLKVPAWDILKVIPFVLDASLTACAHGRLSTRQLATGLKSLADFLPASLVTIASYFSAEVTRGVWKPAFMNGTDWPSPAANLSLVEQQIKKILEATGVDVPSLVVDGDSPATLPLPLAAFVSLTITYKLDKASERLLKLISPAMSALASSCPWPCMPIVTSLWVQKVKRWSNYLVFLASGTVFHHNRDAVVQLLRSCFTSTLGLGSASASIYNNSGVSALLGHGFGCKIPGGVSPVAPGILYLKVYRSIGDTSFLTEEILSILMLSVRDIASSELPKAKGDVKKTKHGMKNGQFSLARSMQHVKHAALLGASLLWISGGPKLVQSLMKETLPSWFLSTNMLELDGGESGVLVAMLRGYALAYFAIFSGTFAWGIDHSFICSKRRAKVLSRHVKFLASTLDKEISLRCHCATWRAYVTGFVSLMVACTPLWVPEVDADTLKRLSRGLIRFNEYQLAFRLLELGGIPVMAAAAEMIIELQHTF
ncbi:unnamed protein product [Lupinus luteus]|uniref:Mediator of RNA polymerase II transcription subunit 33A n=1 Tax=Lupinus luteus TaxID=3873 RepID=A0AAV1WM05_LUPLU